MDQKIILDNALYLFSQQYKDTDNIHTPLERLIELKDSQYSVIRYKIAIHPNASYEILLKLACDDSELTREAALERI